MSDNASDLLAVLYPEGAAGDDDEIRFLGSNQRETLAHYRLLFPSIVSYRGGLFVERSFDKHLVDELLSQAAFGGGGSLICYAEETINSVGLLNEDETHFDLELAKANAAAIGWVWRRWISETFGLEIEVVTSVESADECYVTFRSKALAEGEV